MLGVRTARQRTDAGHEHGERERLGQIVIGAEPEPVDQVLVLGRAGEHEYSATTARGDELRAHLIAVDDREVAIEHDHLVIVDERSC